MKKLMVIVIILVVGGFQIHSTYEKYHERNEEIQQQVEAENKIMKDLYIPFLGEDKI